MNSTRFIKILSFIFAVTCQLLIHSAHASLGGSLNTIESDRAALSGKPITITKNKKFTIQSFDTGAALIKEFVNDSGVVFALSWVGVAPPDFKIILGSYYQDYEQEQNKHPPQHTGKRSHTHHSGKLVLEESGHMRKLIGRAYDSSLLPSGVSADEIQ